MRTVELSCFKCGKTFQKAEKEVNRQSRKGRTHFFCSLSCTAEWGNELRPGKIVQLEKTCELCGNQFLTTSGSKEGRFCSRSCASAGSVSDERRAAARLSGLEKSGNLVSGRSPELLAAVLRSREMHKYLDLKTILNRMGIEHVFEHPIMANERSYIFDLFLPRSKILVEFDGDYHTTSVQKAKDREKDLAAQNLGFKVLRVSTGDNQVIPATVLDQVLPAHYSFLPASTNLAVLGEDNH